MVVGRVNKNCVFFRKDGFFLLTCFASFRLVSLMNPTNYDSINF